MPRLKVSIVFESGARVGPGKAKLLESIRNTGSISAAAREMGMSYKRAWLLLDSMNQAFTEPVVTAAPGGTGGGGATLTERLLDEGPALLLGEAPGMIAEIAAAIAHAAEANARDIEACAASLVYSIA